MKARLSRQLYSTVLTFLAVSAATLFSRPASAEISLAKAGDWDVFSDGRLGGYMSYMNGDGYPVISATSSPFGGGINANVANPIADPTMPLDQPKLESMRVRSGFLGNIVGLGFRRSLTPWTWVTGYIQLVSVIESESRRKYVPAPIDVRQGFMKVEGLWGSVIVGRQLTLFSRGAATIDFLYGHGYGVGFPAAVDSNGTAAGHVGTGVLGPGFAAGAVFVTPRMKGFQLNLGVFDPVALQGAWDRTKWARPEAEATWEHQAGNKRFHLFVNGGYQKAYRIGEPDSISTEAYGVGYGGRMELGPFHLGVAGHWGQGLGLYYALETTEAAYDSNRRLRKSDGYYAQAQWSASKFDINAGVGIARVMLLGASTDENGNVVIPPDGTPDPTTHQAQSLIKYQLGMSAAFVYHFSQTVHFDVDYFRAQYRWQLGEAQDVNFVNVGAVMTW